MTLKEIIDYCIKHNITDVNTVNVQFNISDGGPKCFIDVSENGLTLKENKKSSTLYIDSY